MPEFALLFRPTRPVDAEAQPRRNAAAREWALARNRDGTLLTPAPLEDGGVAVSDRGAEPIAGERGVAAVLIIQAPSLDAAVALAKGHPGLACGTEIEVRPVKPVAQPPR